jgi:hypothetical protein
MPEVRPLDLGVRPEIAGGGPAGTAKSFLRGLGASPERSERSVRVGGRPASFALSRSVPMRFILLSGDGRDRRTKKPPSTYQALGGVVLQLLQSQC